MLTTIAVIAADPVSLFEFAVVQEVFGVDRTEDGVPAFDLRICSPNPGEPLSFGNGAALVAPYPLSAALDVDLVAVPGDGGMQCTNRDDVLATVRDVADRGGRMLSVCAGSLVLAEAGVLDGRRAATHWRLGEEMARRYPAVDVDTDVLFVDDYPIITSAGTAAGIDACLYLVRQELGSAVANAIARRMVVPPHRDGGQRQFVSAPVPDCTGDGFGAVLTWMIDHLDSDISIAQLAERAHMSERTFARRFNVEVGATPHRWLTEQRVLHARNLLESNDFSIDDIAARVGFGSATLLRHHFSAAVGLSPSAYRRQFGAAS